MGKRKRLTKEKVAARKMAPFSARSDAIACGACGNWVDRRQLRRTGPAVLVAGRVLCADCQDVDGLEPLPWRLGLKCEGEHCQEPATEVCTCGVLADPGLKTHLFCWECHLLHHVDLVLEVGVGIPALTALLCAMKDGPELCQRCGMPAECWTPCDEHGRDHFCDWCFDELNGSHHCALCGESGAKVWDESENGWLCADCNSQE